MIESMAEIERKRHSHIFLQGNGAKERFTSARREGTGSSLPNRDRNEHARMLTSMLTGSIKKAENRIQELLGVSDNIPGFHLELNWQGTATELASRNVIAVHPVG